MVTLNFTLTPEAASKIHDLLVCLGKFSETVAIEARREKVGLPLLFCSVWHLIRSTSVHIYRSQLFEIRLRRHYARWPAIFRQLQVRANPWRT